MSEQRNIYAVLTNIHQMVKRITDPDARQRADVLNQLEYMVSGGSFWASWSPKWWVSRPSSNSGNSSWWPRS